jgi:hypothetical protein
MTQQITLDFERPTAPVISPICCEPADAPRLTGQNLRILERLKTGPATNGELSGYALKYTSRISDLRRHGYQINCESLDGGLRRYTLILKEGQH